MKRSLSIEPPFFEIGPKNYLVGNDVVELAKAADAVAEKYDVAVIFTAPYTTITEIGACTRHLRVFAPHLDCSPVGRGLANILPEAVKAAGAVGAMINHVERPLSLGELHGAIRRAAEVGLLTLACADSVAEARATAILGPDMIVCEPNELIGGGEAAGADYARQAIDAIASVNPDIAVMISGGIGDDRDVYNVIMAGADGTGSSSGIVLARDPVAKMDEMIRAVREAWDDRSKGDAL